MHNMEFSKIIIKPLLTEKTNILKSIEPRQYVFEVDPRASKHQIIEAFMAIYQIAPLKVNTQLKKPAKVRTGTIHPGYTRLTKIAYISLPKGKAIAIDSESAEELQKQAKQQPVEKTEKTPAKGTLKEVKKPAEADKKPEANKKVEKPSK